MEKKKITKVKIKQNLINGDKKRVKLPSSINKSPGVLDIDFPIVGVGASAGGLEAFIQILTKLPADTGMAFVFVQHLDPTHFSLAPEILTRSTAMQVHEVADGMRLIANNIYLIPPNVDMELHEGILHLYPRTKSRGQHLSIDLFFKSLALDRKSQAIGVILSGTAADGTQGLKDIKAEGGLTIAQDPKSAKFDGMPRSAIELGIVDIIQTPEEIANELVRIAKHPFISQDYKNETDDSIDSYKKAFDKDLNNNQKHAALNRIFSILKKQKQVDFTDYKLSTIRRRIQRRILVKKSKDLEDYAQYLQDNPDEAHALFSDILINVTDFFRDSQSFMAIKDQIFPALLKNRVEGAPIRVWVVGCSSGEEVYSLAILLVEYLNDTGANFPIQIFATDISEASLKKARAGIYSEDISNQVSKERLQRFFEKTSSGYKINKMIRDLCLFSRHDVANDAPFSKLDLISCRNVMIYFGSNLQKNIFPTFHYALNPGCFLWMGNAESPGENSKLFISKDKTHKIYTKSNNPTPMTLRPLNNPFPMDVSLNASRSADQFKFETDILREADRIALAKYAPPFVMVNANLEILQFRGRTTPYLEPAPGAPSNNLLKMTRPDLLSGMSRVIQKVKKQNIPVREEGLYFEINGIRKTISIEAIPINPLTPLRQKHYLIFFEETESSTSIESSAITKQKPAVSNNEFHENEHSDQEFQAQRILQLEQDLSASKQFHQSLSEEFNLAQEELISANEELQSTNEELQSSNEELETAKEELQSTNEELVTVNDELNNRNKELVTISSDLNNLLNSVEIPILIVGIDHRIRRFTVRCEKAFNLIPGDIGRPIGDIKTSIDLDIDPLIAEVIQTLNSVEKEIKDRQGRWMRLQIRPYRTVDNRIDGVVIALVDFDTIKLQLDESKKARDYLSSISEAVNLPLAVLNDQFCLESGNRAFWNQFKHSQFSIGKGLFNHLNISEESKAEIKALLNDTLQNISTLNKIEVRCEFPGIGKSVLSISSSLIQWKALGSKAILLSLEDITERTLNEEHLQLSARVLSSNLNGIMITDANANIIEINPAFTEITGYEKHEVIGKNPKLLASGLYSKEFYAQMWDKLNNSGLWTGEITNRKKSGAFYPETLSIIAVKDKISGQVKNYIGTFSDISVLKNYQDSLIESRKLAEAASLAKSHFLATMSHEIRTPLNGILGMAQLLVSPDLQKTELQEYVQTILKSGNVLLTLLNDVLDLSKIESGKIDFEHISFNPEQIIFETKTLFAEIANNKSLQLEEKWIGPADQFYIGDPYRLRQIISNLVNNSIKFTQAGKITIEACEIERHEKSAVLEFSLLDTGVGISSDGLTHIFEPFSQEDNSITRKFGGTGLGLSIVAKLVEAMGGHINVTSIPNKGSRFWFRIPVGISSQKEVTTSEKNLESLPIALNSITSGIHKALVIDDDETNRLVIVKMLSRLGIQSTTSENGHVALEYIQKGEKFDFILMDLQMPVMDGYTTTKKIRDWEVENNQPKQIIIAFTADAFLETKNKCLDLDMDDVLTKPVTFDAIQKMMEKYSI